MKKKKRENKKRRKKKEKKKRKKKKKKKLERPNPDFRVHQSPRGPGARAFFFIDIFNYSVQIVFSLLHRTNNIIPLAGR